MTATLETAAPASSSPAPQVLVVQKHSLLWATLVGAVQAFTAGSKLVVGNGRAVDFSAAST